MSRKRRPGLGVGEGFARRAGSAERGPAGAGNRNVPPPSSTLPTGAASQRTSSRAHVIAPSLSSLEEHAKPRHFGQEDRVVAESQRGALCLLPLRLAHAFAHTPSGLSRPSPPSRSGFYVHRESVFFHIHLSIFCSHT